ncbi:ferrochelatase [Dolosicoccus paucivorans]|uniref:Coproporphyrin III ferrochelatase n=1 Tax=Dolosicoccus paucivorans TaxID=84521 RepID=A0A2N6SMU6_9LACT|nr:ferrochelatase [Dolosicoccus paucivorans]PMB84122.1 ferrochelatase [Dolosicoccus paucivorans]PMC58370.1 ferrochelatase [Dolosicoccus paucivorans]
MTQSSKKAILLVNLGSPEAPTISAIRRFLAEFLSDPNVVDLSPFRWRPALYGIVLPTRPKRLLADYQKMWNFYHESPLLYITKNQTQQLQQLLTECTVKFAMTYGEPTIRQTIDELLKQFIDELIVIPLYPQYSISTTRPVFQQVMKALEHKNNCPNLTFISSFYQDDLYIEGLVANIHEAYRKQPFDHLVCSYHGIPLHYAQQGDPYPTHCQKTTKKIQEKLDVPVTVSHCYQSKFGKAEWLTPSLTDHLQSLVQTGVQRVGVIAPSFTADCLETLIEIDEEARELFLTVGGTSFTFIEALNNSPIFIQCLAQLSN